MTSSYRAWCAATLMALGCGGQVTSSADPGANRGTPAPDGATGGNRAGGGRAGAGTAPAQGGSAPVGGSSPSGGAPATGGARVMGGSPSGGARATGGVSGACFDVSITAVPVPSVLELVIDTSESMGELAYPATGNTATRWHELSRVLPGAFGMLPSSWAVGVTFFDTAETGCYVGRARPIDVLTPDHLESIAAAAALRTPYGQRPMLYAWRRGLAEFALWAAPEEYALSPRSLVLITDGVPNVASDGCTWSQPMPEPEYDAEIAAVKSEGEGAGVKTFVVGLFGTDNVQGASYDPLFKLSQWAVAGGTAEPAGCVPTPGVSNGTVLDSRGTYCHLDLTAQADFQLAFLQAMDTIHARARSCRFTVPPPPPDWPGDGHWIALTYSSGTLVPRVLTQASNLCIGGQWYVSTTDLAGYPKTVELCPDACSFFVSDSDAQITATYVCLETP